MPLLAQPSVHREVIELANWGKHLQWGYWKHPPLQTWVTEAFLRFSGRAPWGIYLASQVALTVTFWAVWRLARDVLPPAHALVAVLLLEGAIYYNYNAPKFNHDSLQVPLWALTVLGLWLALTRERLGYWLATGVAAGLGVLSKYTIGVLLLPLGLFLLAHPRARRTLATPGPWLALAAFLLVILPHVLWLVGHDFSTIAFVLERAERPRSRWFEHLWHPIRFAGAQATVLAPTALLLSWLRPRRNDVAGAPPPAPDGFTRAFLVTAALGPLLACVALSAVTGLRLLSGWGRPLWSFIGVLVLAEWRPPLGAAAFRRFAAGVLALAAVWALAFAGQFAVGPALTGDVNPEHFPGQAVGAFVTREWHRRYPTSLPVVGGDKWFMESVAFYSPDRPDGYDLRDSDPRKNPGTSDADFNRRGGVIVWDAAAAGDGLPEDWGSARFPDARVQAPVTVPWQTWAAVPPVRLGWAIVPPTGQ